jgi:hypothetical protein
MELLELSMVALELSGLALELSGLALIKCRELVKLKLSITALISRKLVKLSKCLGCRVLNTVLVNGQQERALMV